VKLFFNNLPKKSFISVIIPVFRDPGGLRDTLESLAHQSLDASEYELIVVNDGGDVSVDMVCEEYDVKLIRIVSNRGSYYARNRAIEESVGEFLAFVDADIIVPPQWLEYGLKALKKADYVGGPVLLDKNKINTPADHYESINGFPGSMYMERDHFAVTANLFIKRVVFENIGGFDERLLSGGDNEFGKRVYLVGMYKQHFADDIIVIHPPRGFSSLVNKRIRTLQGVKVLNRLYPNRYQFNKPALLPYIISTFTPPRIRNIRRQYVEGLPFSFFKYYIFCWKYKVKVNMKKLQVYYGTD
jgi:glycosyltransferase AglI